MKKTAIVVSAAAMPGWHISDQGGSNFGAVGAAFCGL